MTVLAILEGSAFCGGMAMEGRLHRVGGPQQRSFAARGHRRRSRGFVAATVWTSRLVLLVAALLLTETIAVQGAFLHPVLSWLGLVTLS